MQEQVYSAQILYLTSQKNIGMHLKTKLSAIALLIVCNLTAQNTAIRDFLQKLPLRTYTIGTATVNYFADAGRADSAAFTDLYMNKIMPSSTGTVLESHVRVFKSVGCATTTDMREMLLKECKQYMTYTVTNVRVVSDQQNMWGTAPVVVQGELITEGYKFYRTCMAFAGLEELVFLNLVYAQDAGSGYHERFYVQWADKQEHISYLKATLTLPARFVADKNKYEDEYFIMRCDLIGQNEPHIRMQNFTRVDDPDLDIYYMMGGDEIADEKVTYTSAKTLYDDLIKELSQDAALEKDATISQIQKPGKQTVTGPTEAYRITYLSKSETDASLLSVEEVAVSFDKNVYRFRMMHPRTGTTADSRETTFFDTMRKMIYALKPDK